MSNLGNSIKNLDLDFSTLEKLEKNNILTVGELWGLKRAELKDFLLDNEEINLIIIKMQLYGMDLNMKKYTKE